MNNEQKILEAKLRPIIKQKIIEQFETNEKVKDVAQRLGKRFSQLPGVDRALALIGKKIQIQAPGSAAKVDILLTMMDKFGFTPEDISLLATRIKSRASAMAKSGDLKTGGGQPQADAKVSTELGG